MDEAEEESGTATPAKGACGDRPFAWGPFVEKGCCGKGAGGMFLLPGDDDGRDCGCVGKGSTQIDSDSRSTGLYRHPFK